MSDLITVSRAKQVPALAGVSNTELASLISAASAFIEQYVGRTLCQGTFTETFWGTGDAEMFLRQTPLVSITSVTVTDQWDDSTEVLVESDFNIDYVTGMIRYKPFSGENFRWFLRGLANVSVVYVGGYDPIPEDIQQATVDLVRSLYSYTSDKSNPAFQSERLGEYQYTRGAIATETSEVNRAFPATSRMILSKYRRAMVTH